MSWFAGAPFERLVVVRDEGSGLRGIIAIDSTRRGPAFGGIRRRHYADEETALHDARSLARAMSRKCALAGLAAGGAKTVVLVPAPGEPPPDWPAAYRALGRVIDELGGRYVCGPDLGTGSTELEIVRSVTPHVNPAGNDAGASTAAGVIAGIAALWPVLGVTPGPGVRVAIQGLGAVGLSVARALREDGVEVLGADPEPGAAAKAERAGVRLVDPAEILATTCEILVPCATGGVLDREVAKAVRCRAICGSANDQLVDDDTAWMLHRRGIVHAPDIVVSAGAVIEGVLTVNHGAHDPVREEVRAAIARIEDTLRGVLDRSRQGDLPPAVVARALADAAIEATGGG
jgi:glutamate dehydrogenase/leucine dehydrogenase